MEVEFSLNQADLEAFTRSHQAQGQQSKQRTKEEKRFLSTFVYVGLLAVLVAVFLLPGKSTFDKIVNLGFSFFVGLLLGAMGVYLIVLWQGRINIRSTRQYCEDEHNRWMFESQRVRIHPEGITTRSAHQELTNRWSLVWQIVATSEHVLLYTSAQAAHIVPRRAFRDQQHFEEFVALAHQYQQGPKPSGIITSLPPESTAITRPDSL